MNSEKNEILKKLSNIPETNNIKCTKDDIGCCCVCEYQKKLMKHPLNGNNLAYGWLEDRIKFGKGNINQQCGWVCLGALENDTALFFDFEHGFCESFKNKLN